MFRFTVIFLAGAMGALLANRGIAVFNDAVRPIVPEYREGRMTRLEFASTTFGLSFGLVIGFGLPYSLMSSIILVHSLWLGTDIIDTLSPPRPWTAGIRTKKACSALWAPPLWAAFTASPCWPA